MPLSDLCAASMLDDGTEVLAAVDFDVGMVNRVAQSVGERWDHTAK